MAPSNGKGSVDNPGGALTNVRQKFASKIAIVENAKDFAECCEQSVSKLIVLAADEGSGNRVFLDQRWDAIQPLKETQQVHQIQAVNKTCVSHSRLGRNTIWESLS